MTKENFYETMQANGFALEDNDEWVSETWVKWGDFDGSKCVYAAWSDECDMYVVGGFELEEEFFDSADDAIDYLKSLGAIEQ